VVTTDEAAALWRQSLPAASRMLSRLAAAGLVKRLLRGLWSVEPEIDPLTLPEYLTAPFPAYVSFQSALYLHGIISQIPQVIFVASPGRTKRVRSAVGMFSIHHLAPEFFGGFRTTGDSGIILATPEKALLDVFYLSAARSRLFARLPEIEIPEGFDEREARRWIAKIPTRYRRTMVQRRFEAAIARVNSGHD
jgi:predicted transcriptional regulator of viral defense system